MKRGFAEHGDLFALKLGPQYAVIVTGAEHNRKVYTETDKALNMQDGYAFLKESIGELLFTAGIEDYYNQKPLLQEIFRRDRMVTYIEAMNVEIQRWLDSLGQSGEVDLSAAMLTLAQHIAGRAFIGPDYEQELGDDFWKHYGAISESLDFVLPPTWPLPKFIRRDRAKPQLRAIMEKVIAKRRANPEKYNDLITALITTPLKDGSFLPNEMIITMFIGLIFAGHETTAGQAAWMLSLLFQHPDYLKLAQQEIKETFTYGARADASVISQLNHINWAIEETVRLRPTADTQLRTVTTPIQMGEYTIPAGWRVMVSAATSHHLPQVFTDPERFDPLRWSPDRDEGKNTFAIVGFGGGIHKCTGMNFAKNEMAIIAALFFQQFNAELLSHDIHVVTGAGANRPSEVRVHYQRKPLTELTDATTIRDAAAAGCPHIKQQLEAESAHQH
jgi:sterol 14-demethylase